MKKYVSIFVLFIVLTTTIFSANVQGSNLHFIAVSGADQHTLALDSEGNVWSWGMNQFGQLGDGTTVTRPYRIKVNGLPPIKKIAAGGMSSYAIDQEGNVWSWGNNYNGQLGDGTNSKRYYPQKVKGLTEITDISAGSNHVLALKNDGTVWAWGDNYVGQLGNDSYQDSYIPIKINNLTDVASISAGGFHSLALLNNGDVLAWGTNSSGMLGLENVDLTAIPTKIRELSDVTSISAGQYFSVARKNDGTVWTWGENDSGQLGNGTVINSNHPIQVAGLNNVKKVVAGIHHTMALLENGEIWSWGIDWTTKDPTNITLGYKINSLPFRLYSSNNVADISTSSGNYVVLTNDGNLLVWGTNRGLLGDGTAIDRRTPSLVVDSLISDNTRLFGKDRIETALSISKKMFPVTHSVNSIILATSNNFPDALVGASLGVKGTAPLLLVNPTTDNKEVFQEISRILQPGGTVYILGGTGVIPTSIETKIKDLDKPETNYYRIKRLAGQDRYLTAVEIAKQVQTKSGGEVIIATGTDFPDSLSISPYAASKGIPMVLVQNDRIPTNTLDYLKNINPDKITIVGGTGVVNQKVENELKKTFSKSVTRRLGGMNRYETSAIIAKQTFGDSSKNIFFATGINFPDALAGSIFAGSTSSPIILTQQNDIPNEVNRIYLSQISQKKVVILGGQGVISDNVFHSLEKVLN